MLGKRLRETRIARGLSQEALAYAIGTTQMQVWRIENGKITPNARTLAAIAQKLEVSADYLLGLVNAPDETYPTALETPLSEFQHKCWQALRTDDLPTLLELIAQALRTQCLRSGD